MELKDNMRHIRETLGLSQRDLARRMGIEVAATVSHWECGRRHPSLENLYALRMALGCSWDALLGSPYSECGGEVGGE